LIALRDFLTENGFDRVPLRRLASHHYKLNLRVNGKKASFILDTGASASCLDENLAQQYALSPNQDEILATGAGSSNFATHQADNVLIDLGNLQLQQQSLILLDLSHVNHALAEVNEAPVEGILGADLLKARRAVIDYGRNCLYLK